jgi:hypothetical protein
MAILTFENGTKLLMKVLFCEKNSKNRLGLILEQDHTRGWSGALKYVERES